MSPVPSRRQIGSRSIHRFAAIALLSILPGLTQAGIDKSGRWSAVKDWSQGNNQRYAVHLVLLHGDGSPYHSRVLWWRGEAPNKFLGGLWGWRAATDTCLAWPESSFVDIGVDPSEVNFFCGGHSSLSDGRLLLVSGTSPSTGTYGENRTRLFTPGAGTAKGTWATTDSLDQWRWYSTATTMADGRVLVTAGSQHRFHRVFGGRRSGVMPADAQGDELHRFSGVVGGDWEGVLTPSDDGGGNGDPDVREHHTLVEMGPIPNFGHQVLFGGRDRDGNALDDAWMLRRHNNDLGADYSYSWDKFDAGNSQGSPPSARSDHTALVALQKQLVVFGGLGFNGIPRNDIHRLYWNSTDSLFTWAAMDVSGTTPSPRLGHEAVYQETELWSGTTVKQMLVFGGSVHPDSLPTDDRLWRLTFSSTNDNQGTWEEVTTTDLGSTPRRPHSRYGHAIVRDSNLRKHPTLDSLGYVAFVHGGKLSTGSYSDTLWALWTFKDGTTRWEVIADDSSSVFPGPRAQHSITYDSNQGPAPTQQPGGRLYLFGGMKSDSELADSSVYVMDPWAPVGGRQWKKWESSTSTFTGHTMTLEFAGVIARVAEVYDPNLSGGQWDTHSNANLVDRNYPVTFSIESPDTSKRRVITIPAAQKPFYLDVPATGSAGAWQASGARKLGFIPLNGVLYKPDRMMVGGGHGGGLIVDSSC